MSEYKEKYVAHFRAENEYEEFDTFEEAEKWLFEAQHYDDGFSLESMQGGDYIAKITHRSKYTETDCKENYHEHTDMCTPDCEREEWPYSNEYDVVGEMTMEAVNETERTV